MNNPSASSEPIDVSVVIPCLNEAKSIAFCIQKALKAFERSGIRGEVVVADNGSSDGSVEIARQHGVRVAHATLKGYGHALRAGSSSSWATRMTAMISLMCRVSSRNCVKVTRS